MKRWSGFTLWELLIVVAIIGILANLTIPTFSAFTQQRRSDVIAVQIDEMFRYSRTEALRRNSSIMVCGASSKYIAHTVESDIEIASCLSDGSVWSNGILAIVNDAKNSGTGMKIKAMSIESASFSSAQVIPYYATNTNGSFIINKDSTLQDDGKGRYPCFDIQQKINGKISHVIIAYTNRYGNAVKCRDSTALTSGCGCQ